MFFSYYDIGVGFKVFSVQHLLASMVFALLPCWLAWRYRHSLANWRHEKVIRNVVGISILIVEFSLYAWYVFAGKVTDWRPIVPTSLCGLTIYLGAYAMITLDRRIAPVVYYYAFGAFFSFIFVELEHGYDRYRFYNYFILHGFILISTVYFHAVHRIPYDVKALRRSILILTPVLIASVVLNPMLDANFFYMEYPIIRGFPVFEPAYVASKYLYSALAFLAYFALMGIMFLIAKLLRMNILTNCSKSA